MQSSITNVLLEAKRKKNISYAHLGKALGADPIWIAALFYGQARATGEEATKLLSLLELDGSLAEILTDFPVKGALDALVPTDPFLYRFYEILQVYGMPMKAVIQEEFGDGIVSAVDFSLNVHRQEDPKGDRVVITMNGKFLPYKKW